MRQYGEPDPHFVDHNPVKYGGAPEELLGYLNDYLAPDQPKKWQNILKPADPANYPPYYAHLGEMMIGDCIENGQSSARLSSLAEATFGKKAKSKLPERSFAYFKNAVMAITVELPKARVGFGQNDEIETPDDVYQEQTSRNGSHPQAPVDTEHGQSLPFSWRGRTSEPTVKPRKGVRPRRPTRRKNFNPALAILSNSEAPRTRKHGNRPQVKQGKGKTTSSKQYLANQGKA